MFNSVTRNIAVSVEPSYQPHESDPDDDRYVWAYRVTIRNGGAEGVQLLARHWLITDGNGLQREVNGRGVVGQQPTIPPGGSFEYTSGCPLTTGHGIMVGSYKMISESGEMFDVAIPAFSLDLPDSAPILH